MANTFCLRWSRYSCSPEDPEDYEFFEATPDMEYYKGKEYRYDGMYGKVLHILSNEDGEFLKQLGEVKPCGTLAGYIFGYFEWTSEYKGEARQAIQRYVQKLKADDKDYKRLEKILQETFESKGTTLTFKLEP